MKFSIRSSLMDDEDNTVKVDPNIETICCDGGQDSLGHPAVYYTFNEENKIVCSYCSKIFVKKKDLEDIKNV